MEIDPKQLKLGIKIEKEHSNTITGDKAKKTRKIALDHLKEIPDYYTRLKKMEKEAGVKEAWVDPIEVLHKATMARIYKGAKEGKYWLLRSEGAEESVMNETDRNELIRKILETTTTGAIGGRSMPFGGGGDFKQNSDLAFGGRNKVAPAMLRNAVNSLCKGKSRRHPVV